ncbi:diaminopimelate decarboxylase [Corynebacterium choanae]|uniref:Diaminopimelate decarboxylase n=1 Tax=Corynebacterium choanae TaxID=1862358 RepID=A0A3G6J6A9_9CORY|nr:diaminopimelate decarboxylase [Corynebacterium choanae]AZA13303.1 Diaminopimelate decarboxylase [Corynebacterium choanae]
MTPARFNSPELRANTGLTSGTFDSVEKRAFQGAHQSITPAVATQFNELPAHVWPATATRDEDGVVAIGGVKLTDLVAEYATPLFVVDEEDFRSRCQAMAAAFGGAHHVHYASKAMLTKRIARWVNEEGLSLDVASLGELQIALAANFPAERITAHGNNKSEAFLTLCVTAGVGHVVLDAPQEIGQLNAIARAHNSQQEVLVRVKPGIEAHTHEFIATSHEDQKFGFSLASGAAKAACLEAVAASNLELVGLHCHVGSQVFDAQGFSLAAQRLLHLMRDVRQEIRPADADRLTLLDLGGGYGIAYVADQQPLDVSQVAHTLLNEVARQSAELEMEQPTVLVEPGRAIAGPAAVTVYTVGNVKDVHTAADRTRRYLAIDGGMSDNIRPALYAADYEARVANRNTSGSAVSSRLVGSHCESGDILISEALWPDDIATGDLLAVAATGAYCYAMSSRYNMMLRPAIVSVRDGKASLMMRRETLDDVLALDCDK